MSDREMLIAYDRAALAYEAAKAGKGDRVRTFVEFVSTETALVSRFGHEVYLKPYFDHSLRSSRE